jgi:hypothetical protein
MLGDGQAGCLGEIADGRHDITPVQEARRVTAGWRVIKMTAATIELHALN